MKKRVLLLLLLSLLSLSLIAADEGEWWYGKTIQEFSYNGLQNVSEKSLNKLLSGYLGKEFTAELAQEIDNTMYTQSWMDYYSLAADHPESDANGLKLVFTIQEIPQIKDIVFEGTDRIKPKTLSEQVTVKKGDFYVAQKVKANVQTLLNFYYEKGYPDATVSYQATFDEKSNTELITYMINEGRQYKVSEIVFKGVTAFTDKELKKQLSLKERSFFRSGNYSLSAFNADAFTLKHYYNNFGYSEMKVTNSEVEDVTTPEDKYKMVRLVFTVEEGPQWLIGDISFTGNKIFDDEFIKSGLILKTGEVNNSDKINQQQTTLGDLYYNEGYITTQIQLQPIKHEDTHVCDYEITIQEGAQSHIEKIVISGLTKTKPHVIERELTLHVGDIFSKEKLVKSGQNIYNTSLVKDVQSNLYQGTEENGVVLEFTVEEGNQIELQFGATFGGTIDGFPVSGFLQWSDKNLGGTGRDFSVNTTLSPDTQSVTLSLSDDWVGNRRWSNGISLTLERSQKKNVLQRGNGSAYYDGRDDAHITFPLGYDSYADWDASGNTSPGSENLMSYDFYKIAVGYNTGYTFMFQPGSLTVSTGISIGLNRALYDDNRNDPYEYLIRKYHDRWQFSNKYSLSLTWDGRDLKENTTRGYMLSAGYTYAGGILGGLSNYNKLSFSAAGFHKIIGFTNEDGENKNIVGSLTSTVSFMLPQYWNNNDADGWGTYEAYKGATKYEMLYIDGMNVGRGFSTITDQSFLWHNQLDVSFPIVTNMVLLEGFVSATGATKRLEDLNGFGAINWYYAAGFGIKLKVPGFPLGLYLVKNAKMMANEDFTWVGGSIFGDGDSGTKGMKLVLAITTSIY